MRWYLNFILTRHDSTKLNAIPLSSHSLTLGGVCFLNLMYVILT